VLSADGLLDGSDVEVARVTHRGDVAPDATYTGVADVTLPQGISGLCSLQTLRMLYYSSLKALPEEISALGSLQTLNLSGCTRLAALPDGIGGLSSLQMLHLSGNPGLANLPQSFSGLSSLHPWSLRTART